MILSRQTAERIANEIRAYLGQGRCAYVAHNETSGRVETFQTGCQLRSGDWTDGSRESVRVFQRDDESVWIGFSIAGLFFQVQEGDHVSIGRSDGVRIRFQAPCGDHRLDWLKLEGSD